MNHKIGDLSRAMKTFFLLIFKDHQIEAGAGLVGDGGWIEPQFVILFSEWGSIQFCFLSKIDICL